MKFQNAKLKVKQIPGCPIHNAMGKASSVHYKKRSCLCYAILGYKHKNRFKLTHRRATLILLDVIGGAL
jgi:hypothetical protein